MTQRSFIVDPDSRTNMTQHSFIVDPDCKTSRHSAPPTLWLIQTRTSTTQCPSHPMVAPDYRTSTTQCSSHPTVNPDCRTNMTQRSFTVDPNCRTNMTQRSFIVDPDCRANTAQCSSHPMVDPDCRSNMTQHSSHPMVNPDCRTNMKQHSFRVSPDCRTSRHSTLPTLQSIQTAGQVHVHSPQMAGCGTLKKHPACPWCWSTAGPSPRSWSEGCRPCHRCPAPGCNTGNERHHDGGVTSRSIAHKEIGGRGRVEGEREREQIVGKEGAATHTHTHMHTCTHTQHKTHTHMHTCTHTHTHTNIHTQHTTHTHTHTHTHACMHAHTQHTTHTNTQVHIPEHGSLLSPAKPIYWFGQAKQKSSETGKLTVLSRAKRPARPSQMPRTLLGFWPSSCRKSLMLYEPGPSLRFCNTILACKSLFLFTSVQDGTCSGKPIIMCSTLSLLSFPYAAFETVPISVRLTMALLHPFKEGR